MPSSCAVELVRCRARTIDDTHIGYSSRTSALCFVKPLMQCLPRIPAVSSQGKQTYGQQDVDIHPLCLVLRCIALLCPCIPANVSLPSLRVATARCALARANGASTVTCHFARPSISNIPGLCALTLPSVAAGCQSLRLDPYARYPPCLYRLLASARPGHSEHHSHGPVHGQLLIVRALYRPRFRQAGRSGQRTRSAVSGDTDLWTISTALVNWLGRSAPAPGRCTYASMSLSARSPSIAPACLSSPSPAPSTAQDTPVSITGSRDSRDLTKE